MRIPLACIMERLTRLDTRMGSKVGESEGSRAWTRQFRGDISTEKQHPSRPDHCYYCFGLTLVLFSFSTFLNSNSQPHLLCENQELEQGKETRWS